MDIPNLIDNSERIVRVLFYPSDFEDGKLCWIAFRSSNGADSASVIRIDFCSENFCKDWGKNIQRKENGRGYYGLGVLNAIEIRSVGAEVIYSKTLKNLYHSHITVGYKFEKGKVPPANVKHKLEILAEKARKYKDSAPDQDVWIDSKVV